MERPIDERAIGERQEGEKKGLLVKFFNLLSMLFLVAGIVCTSLYLIPSSTDLKKQEGSSSPFLLGLAEFRDSTVDRVPGSLKNLGKPVVDKATQTIELPEDSSLYSNGDGKMLTYSAPDGDRLYAPTPIREFRNESCELSPKSEVRLPSASSWTIPSLSLAASYTLSGYNNSPMTIPNAPIGTMYASDAQFGDKEGSILQVGHVNYHENPWAVSPWGNLYQLQPCTHIYQAAPDGSLHEFVVTDLYTVKHEDFPKNEEYFRLTGDLALYMVTCSGPAVGDAGLNFTAGQTSFNLGYEYNLVVKAVPVSSS